MRRARCPSCDARLQPGEQTCQECGAPLSYEPGEADVVCRVCDEEIGAFAETCPACGERGYPALRPRTGKGFRGAPAGEDGEGE